MQGRYELLTRPGALVECRIVGPDVEFVGSLRRGYLTTPPGEFRDDDGAAAFTFGGSRRIAPRAHLLKDPEGVTLAVFRTPIVSAVVDRRTRVVERPDGIPILLLRPGESDASTISDTVRAALTDGHHRVLVDGAVVGSLRPTGPDEGVAARARRLFAQVPDVLRSRPSPARRTGSLTIQVDLDRRLCAALLLYDRFVIQEGRRPE